MKFKADGTAVKDARDYLIDCKNENAALRARIAALEAVQAAATEFEVMPQIYTPTGRCFGEVRIRRMEQRDGSMKWAVYQRGWVLNKQTEWEMEPIPSSRTDEYLDKTRFDNLVEAWGAATNAIAMMPVQFTPAALDAAKDGE